jgi:hypothetical protein
MHKLSTTTWDCRQAKAEIALKAGGDAVESATATLLESHLAECPRCRTYLAEMTASLEALQASATSLLPSAMTRSLWPRVAARLPQTRPLSASARFNVWVPTAAMATACAAMILVTIVQLERVVPFEPLVTPHLKMVLQRDQSNHFHDSHTFEPGRRPLRIEEPSNPIAVPVLHYGPEASPRDRGGF